jgi:hypothetical protein
MSDIYLLCEWDELTHGAHNIICWYADQAKAEAEAERLQWAKYQKNMTRATVAWWRPISPDKHKDWTYFVEVVSQGAET